MFLLKRPPAGDHTTIGPRTPRVGAALTALLGAAIGSGAWLISELLVPMPVANAAAYDSRLADALGFVCSIALALWVGWLRRSALRAAVGILVAGLLSSVCQWLPSSGIPMAVILIDVPTSIVALLAVALGFDRGARTQGLVRRITWGLIACLVFEVTFAVAFGVSGISLMGFDVSCYRNSVEPSVYVQRYVWAIRRAGPVSLGIATAVFLPLFQRAVCKETSQDHGPSAQQIDAF